MLGPTSYSDDSHSNADKSSEWKMCLLETLISLQNLRKPKQLVSEKKQPSFFSVENNVTKRNIS